MIILICETTETDVIFEVRQLFTSTICRVLICLPGVSLV
jgi:hypothetical protein